MIWADRNLEHQSKLFCLWPLDLVTHNFWVGALIRFSIQNPMNLFKLIAGYKLKRIFILVISSEKEIQLYVKVRQSQKQIMVSSNLPKNEQNALRILSTEHFVRFLGELRRP